MKVERSQQRRSRSRGVLVAFTALSSALGGCGPPKSAAAGAVILNEVGCHNRDFVEIVNRSGSTFDVSGWRVADHPGEDGHEYELPSGTALQVDEYFVVKKTEGLEAGFPFGLACGSDTAYLLDRQ